MLLLNLLVVYCLWVVGCDFGFNSVVMIISLLIVFIVIWLCCLGLVITDNLLDCVVYILDLLYSG